MKVTRQEGDRTGTDVDTGYGAEPDCKLFNHTEYKLNDVVW